MPCAFSRQEFCCGRDQLQQHGGSGGLSLYWGGRLEATCACVLVSVRQCICAEGWACYLAVGCWHASTLWCRPALPACIPAVMVRLAGANSDCSRTWQWVNFYAPYVREYAADPLIGEPCPLGALCCGRKQLRAHQRPAAGAVLMLRSGSSGICCNTSYSTSSGSLTASPAWQGGPLSTGPFPVMTSTRAHRARFPSVQGSRRKRPSRTSAMCGCTFLVSTGRSPR